jgi:hypothetical protein
MRIGKPLAALVGALTICATGFMLFLMATTVPQMLRGLDHEQGPQLYRYLSSPMRSLTVPWILLLAFYLSHLFRTPQLERDARVSWGIAFVLFGPLAELLYWWRHIWPHKPAAALDV